MSEIDKDELREAAESMGVEDADAKDADELTDEVQHAQTDSTSSPSNPDWEENGPRDDVAGDG